MKKFLVSIIIILSLGTIGFSFTIYLDPIADEKWTKPSVDSLMVQSTESFLTIEKMALIDMFKSTLTVYNNTKNSSLKRIGELKSTVVLLIFTLTVSLLFIIYLSICLFKLKSIKPYNKPLKQDK